MGVGKTTLGKRLANALSIPFHDLDREIESRVERTVPEIFRDLGEPFFRKTETSILRDYCTDEEMFVLSTGGGVGANSENMELMKSAGVVIWLQLSEEMLFSRLKQSKTRPLLFGKTDDELRTFIEEQLSLRAPIYAEADIHFNTADLSAERLKELVEAIHSK